MNAYAWELFTKAVNETFRRSTLFQIIREHRSPKVAAVLDDLEKDILYWFQSEGEVFPDEIAFHIEDVLQSINTEIEYDEGMEMGRMLHDFYSEVAHGRFEKIEAFVATIANQPMQSVRASHAESDSSSDEELTEDVEMENTQELATKPQRTQKNQADDEGWFTA